MIVRGQWCLAVACDIPDREKIAGYSRRDLAVLTSPLNAMVALPGAEIESSDQATRFAVPCGNGAALKAPSVV
jgi:hypothetical protein